MGHHYKDVDLAFTPHPVTKDVSIKTGSRAIMQSLREIVLTTKKDWDNEREFGVGVHDMLGENLNPLDTVDLQTRIEEQIGIYEPRVEIEQVNIGTTVSEPNTLRIQIVFYVRNEADPQTLSIPLVRLR